MAEVTETVLPGVGVRHEFTTQAGERVGVLVLRNGRREVLVYDRRDPDASTAPLHLTTDDSRTLAELLGASQVSETVTAVQQQIEGLAIEWLEVDPGSAAVGTTIAEGAYRTRTGASIVAVLRDGTSIPAPGPELAFQAEDVVVAVGTTTGLSQLRSLLHS